MSTKQTQTCQVGRAFRFHQQCTIDKGGQHGQFSGSISVRPLPFFVVAILAIISMLPYDLMSINGISILRNEPKVFKDFDDNPPFSLVTYQIIPSGSFIINMGVQPQTVNNALKPYGLIWDLLENHRVPIIWSINPGKSKDAVDFTYNGIDYKGGPFIISAEYRSAAVNAKIASWQALGVVGVTTTSDITVPVNRVLNYSMRWTLDSQNGSIAEKFLQNAGIPSSGYNWVAPNALTCCNDLFVMPHADPTWSSHSTLLTWNNSEANGGCRGAIWAGCKAVSELENIVNPSNPSQRLNFLTQNPVAPATNPAVPAGNHADGNPPYSYTSNNDHPVMQFMGVLDGGQESGAEQVYLPTTGWRPSTIVGVWDPTQPNLGTLSPGPAAKLAFGPAFGDSNRGCVNYTGGHDIAKSNNEPNIAAQRTFFNFSFMALYDKSIKPVTVVPSVTYSGQSYLFSASATGGSGSYSYTWTSSCGGTFSNPNSASSSFTAPIVTTSTTCTIQLTVTDGCANRTSFKPIQITLLPAEHEICNNGIDDDGDGLADCQDSDCVTLTNGWNTASYKTIADGSWTNAATWQGGLMPGTDISNKTVLVKHSVTTNNDLKLMGGSKVWVVDGGLTSNGANITIENGTLELANASLNYSSTGNLELTLSSANFRATNSSVSVGSNFSNSLGKRRLENVCLNVDQNFFKSGGTDTLINVCANIGTSTSGNGIENAHGSTFVLNSEFNLPNGNFFNQSSATITGGNLVVRVQNGNLDNNGTWTVNVSKYCVSGSVNVPTAYLPTTEDCATIASHFSPCVCTCDALTPEICNNSIDDDNDGFVDNTDSDCFNAGNCTSTPAQNDIAGTVFYDPNGNQLFDNGENTQSGVTLTLFKDNNSDGAVDAGDTQLATKVTDSSGKYGITVTPAFASTYDNRINAACNDGRNGNNGENKLQFGKDKNIGLRFTGINIPAGATISSAYLYFVANSNQNSSGSVDVYANKTANPSDFCSNSNVNLRTRTTAKTAWTVGGWSNGTEYQSADVKNVVQELVTTYGAYSNGSIAIILISTGSNNVEAKSYETNNNSTQAPKLVINYTLNNTEKYVVRLETNSLPPFTQLTTPSTAAISFTASGTANCNNVFGFRTKPETCNNGLDDDGDGLIDCVDSDCNLGLQANAGTGVTICASGSTTLTASATGGVSPYTFAWSNSLGSGASKSVTPASTTTYTVTVTSANGCTASSQVTVTVVAAPTISTQPANASICIGGTQTLSVIATGGTPSLTYQWQSSLNGNNNSWSNIIGATSSSFITPALLVNTYYRVVVSASGSGCASTTSNNALVTVVAGPTITSQPTGATICSGGTQALSVIATGGTPSATYQWQTSVDNVTFANISGATSNSYTTPALTSTTYYRVVVGAAGAGCGSVTSSTANVAVVAKPSITTQPSSASLCSGSGQTLSVTATGGTPSLTYQWQSSTDNITFSNINGATSSSYNSGSLSATRYYRVIVSASGSGCGSVTSNVATLTVSTLLANAGSNLTICSGTSATLSATATGGQAPYTYNWSNLLGSGASKTVNPLVSTTYTVTVTSSNGCTATSQVTVSVNPTPTSDAGLDVTICNGASTTLTASSTSSPGQITYAWSNGYAGKTQTVSPIVTTTYTVTVTHNNGCFSTDQVVVTVQNCAEICNNGLDDDYDGLADCADSGCGPSANAGPDISVCPGTPALLNVGVTGGSAPYTYLWNNGLGLGASKTVSPLVTTTYTVTVTSASGCTSVDQIAVIVLPCSENCTNGIDDDGDGLIDCADPDCSGVTAPVLANDTYSTCPGMTFSERVTYNDGNLNNPLFSIVVPPQHGSVTIDWTGKFTYAPNSFLCQVDYFTYQVCNQPSGCCKTAVVTMNLSDSTLPVLTNVPADLTINCDDAIPQAPVVTAFDQCPGIFMDFAETTSQNYVGACGSYTITRTWTATDFCGNAATKNQKITVLDQTKPELFRVYTMEGGAKMVAGLAQRVTHDWKYVKFPITFKVTPVLFANVSTNTDAAPVVTQIRNLSMQGFEVRLREEEAADGAHGLESVSWVAMDASVQNGNMKWEAGSLANVDEAPEPITFSQTYDTAPLLFTNAISNKQSDPATLRHLNLTGTGVEVFSQEEQSADAEVARLGETVAYLAIKQNSVLRDKENQSFGEAGQLQVTNAWATVNLTKKYTKPVVIVGGTTNNEGQPVTARIRNIASNKFEVRLQEWQYQDGNHAPESVSWMVVEGSVSANATFYCSGNGSVLQANVNVFALDNCDDLVALGFNESASQTVSGLIRNQTWTAVDDCGNTTFISRYDTCQVAALKAKAMLYGAMLQNGGGNTMRDDLRQHSMVPTVEPYSMMPSFPYVQNNNTQVTICHNPGQPDQQTMTVSSSELQAHLDHGDVLGSCGPLPPPIPAGALSATYRTIADGNWSSPSTWKNGMIPPTGNLIGQLISIEHKVTLQSGFIWLKNDSKLWITNGGLKIVSGDLNITGSSLYALNSSIDVSGWFYTWTQACDVNIKNCEIKTGLEFAHTSGKRRMENVCVNAGTDFTRGWAGVLDTLINVTATVNGSFKNWKNGSMYMSNCKFRIVNGSFRNEAGNTINGNGLTVLVENGGLINLGEWNASVDQYCVSGLVSVPILSLPNAMDCNNIFNWVASCSMDGNLGNNSGGNNGGGTNGGTGVTQVEGPVNANGGVVNPAILQVSGATAVVDWILIELRDVNDEAEVQGYATVLLKRNGDLVSVDGDSLIVFPDLTEGNYYVTIRHRNHLGITTQDPIYLTVANPPMVDFNSPALPVKGGNSAGRINNGNRTLWGGDFNGDGKIIYQGPYNDVFNLFSRVVGDSNNSDNLANYIVPGYEMQDFNLDGKVIYQGPNNDRGAMLFYSILAHPSNGNLLANYIVLDFIP